MLVYGLFELSLVDLNDVLYLHQAPVEVSLAGTNVQYLHRQLVVEVSEAQLGPHALPRDNGVDANGETQVIEAFSEMGVIIDLVPVLLGEELDVVIELLEDEGESLSLLLDGFVPHGLFHVLQV